MVIVEIVVAAWVGLNVLGLAAGLIVHLSHTFPTPPETTRSSGLGQ